MTGPASADFDVWNDTKKDIHAHGVAPLFKEREVWWCALGVNVQREQNGDTIRHNGLPATFRRPVLVLRKFGPESCAILPLTTRGRGGSFDYPLGQINGRENWALLSRVISAARLSGGPVFTLPPGRFQAVIMTPSGT